MSNAYDSEDVDYVPELHEFSEEEVAELSDAFWKRLEYAKELDEKLEAVGVEIGVSPSVEDEEADITFGEQLEGDRSDFAGGDLVSYDWEDAPPVLNLISDVGGAVVRVSMWQNEKEEDLAQFRIVADFPHLAE